MPGSMELAKHEDEEGAHDLSYKSRPPLTKPGTYLRDIKYLINAMDCNEIDVNPEYQREVVWTADRMSQLIDSLMENFYIPPIILNRLTNEVTGKLMLVCVDGKQRLSSIKAFVQGIIPCQDYRGEKWWFRNAHVQGKKKNILSATAQEEFLNKEFVTFEYTNLRPEQEEDLFARVQMGMPLSTAEKMRAQSGPWQELARHFCNDFSSIYSLQKDRMRAKDFQLTLSCFSQILEVQNPTPTDGIPMHKTTHNYLLKLLKKTDYIDDDLKSHLASVWKTLHDLIEQDPDTFTNADRRLKGVQTFAPVEMVAVTVLISVHLVTPNDRRLLDDIRSLRDNLRENFSDLRMNNYVWKAIWSFIDNLRPVDDQDMADGDVPTGSGVPPSQSAREPAITRLNKNRPTTRTKLPKQFPRATSNTDVKLEQTETGLDISESRSRKRQRTGSNSSTTVPHASSTLDADRRVDYPSIRVRPTPASTEEAAFRPMSPSSETSTLFPFASLGDPINTPSPAKASQRSVTSGTATSRLRNSEKQVSAKASKNVSLISNTSPTSGSKTPFMPAEVRRHRKSELNSYRAPVAPMGSDLTSHSTTPAVSSQETPTAPPSLPLQGAHTMLRFAQSTAASAHGYRPTTASPVTTQAPAPVIHAPRSPCTRNAPHSECMTNSDTCTADATTNDRVFPVPIVAQGNRSASSQLSQSKKLPNRPYRQVLTHSSPSSEPQRPGLPSNEPMRPADQPQNLGPTSLASQMRAPAPPSERSQADTKRKQKKKPEAIPQYDGVVIDLTDDEPETIEEQRANLLSTFQNCHNVQHS